MKQTKIRRSPLSYERKKQYYAYGFIALWLVGVIFYFFRPLVQMVAYSLSDIVLTDTGYHLDFVGLKEFDRALRTDNKFIQNLAGSLGAMLYQVPVVVFFSLAVAVLLNKPFRGRTVARAVFFIPVIVTSGVVLSVLNGSGTSGENTLLQAQSSNMFSIRGSSDVLYELGLPQQIVTLLVDTANNIFNLSWKSGVQILIFLAALQTISPSLFEAARVEGANAWDTFWKLTIPVPGLQRHRQLRRLRQCADELHSIVYEAAGHRVQLHHGLYVFAGDIRHCRPGVFMHAPVGVLCGRSG